MAARLFGKLTVQRLRDQRIMSNTLFLSASIHRLPGWCVLGNVTASGVGSRKHAPLTAKSAEMCKSRMGIRPLVEEKAASCTQHVCV